MAQVWPMMSYGCPPDITEQENNNHKFYTASVIVNVRVTRHPKNGQHLVIFGFLDYRTGTCDHVYALMGHSLCQSLIFKIKNVRMLSFWTSVVMWFAVPIAYATIMRGVCLRSILLAFCEGKSRHGKCVYPVIVVVRMGAGEGRAASTSVSLCLLPFHLVELSVRSFMLSFHFVCFRFT
jgi:hypothetical protein